MAEGDLVNLMTASKTAKKGFWEFRGLFVGSNCVHRIYCISILDMMQMIWAKAIERTLNC